MTEDDRYEIRFGGSGGQGIILAAVIFAEAAGIHEGFNVCQTQSYGPEARGGKSKAEVVISSSEIDYPKVIRMDLFLAMNQAALDAYFTDMKPTGLLLADATFVQQLPTGRAVCLPFTRIARDELGKQMVANIVALGAVSCFNDRVSYGALEQAVLNRVPPRFKDINLKALQAGARAAREIDITALPHFISQEEDKEV